MKNINKNQIKNIGLINWGFNEISSMKIYEISNEIFFKLEIIWETNRKIIIDFIDLEIK